MQIGTLARALAKDLRFDITVLTANDAREGREIVDGVSVVTSPLWGRRPTDTASPSAPEPDALDRAASAVSRIAAPLTLRVVDRLRRLGLAAPQESLWVRQTRDRWLRAFRTINADVYVMRCATPQVGFAQDACRRLRRRFVYMVAHEIDVNGEFATGAENGDWFERGLLRADVVICQHADQLATFRARYAGRAEVIRSLLPTPIGGPPASQRRTVLWIARLDPWKRPDVLVDLAARLPHTPFVMVAPRANVPGADRARLLDRIAERPNIRWIERVPFDDTDRLFDEAMVFVNTSDAEGFPNTFMQAAARGTPIVSWRVDPESMLGRHDMGVCVHENADRLEAEVRALVSDPARRQRLGDNGRRYVLAEHDPAGIAARYGDLFLSLCGRAPRAPSPSRSTHSA